MARAPYLLARCARGALALCLLLVCGAWTQTRRPPDVLILLADDLGWADFELLPTPNLDALAARGVTYRRFYVMPVCSPSRYALLFGRYGRRDGIGTIIASYLPPSRENRTPKHDLPSLAKLFKEHGYATGLFGKWHLGSNFLSSPHEVSPHLHGFDVFRAGALANLGSGGGSGYFDWRRVDDGHSEMTSEYATFAQRNALLSWWKAREEPKLAVLALSAAHDPYHDPPEEALPPGWPEPRSEREQFEALVVSMDLIIGEILGQIDTSRTLVLFLTDNGTANIVDGRPPDPQGEEQEKHSTFEPGVNVPLIVAGPGVAAGRECRALAHAVDLYATLADWLGSPALGSVPEDSLSFASTFASPDTAGHRKWVFTEEFSSGHGEQAVITQRYKLRVLKDEEQLFDLVLDPLEETPLDLTVPAFQAIRNQLAWILENEVPERPTFGPAVQDSGPPR